MQSHFSRVADAYRAIRTTDLEPIFFIKEKMKERGRLTGADIGCGAGRYDQLLLDHLPFSHLLCLDANPGMAKTSPSFPLRNPNREIRHINLDVRASSS